MTDMNIDERIARIAARLSYMQLRGDGPLMPLSEREAAEFEQRYGIRLPEEYRRFITTATARGRLPWGELYSLDAQLPHYAPEVAPDRKFPYTVSRPLDISVLSEEQYDALFDDGVPSLDTGFLPLQHEGCGMFAILVVNTDDQETYGTVWRYDLTNDTGIYPMKHPTTGGTMRFLDWLEWKLDQSKVPKL